MKTLRLMYVASIALGLFATTLLVSALAVQAAPQGNIYTINGTGDSVGACSPSIGSYLCPSLRSAVIAANAHPGSIIQLSHGAIYTLTIPPSGSDDATTGDLNITADTTFNYSFLCLLNCGATIRGGAGWNDRILYVAGGAHVDGSQLTIRNGNVITAGGGILNNGALSLANSTIVSNSAGWGGGIQNYGTLTLTNSAIVSNTIGVLGIGGGLASGDWDGSALTVTLDNCQVTGNQTPDRISGGGQGGGIWNYGPLVINGGSISHNVSDALLMDFSSGGIYHKAGRLIMTGTLVSTNIADGVGGIYIGTIVGTDADLTNVTVAQNIGGSGIGGIWVDGAQVTLEQSTIFSNMGDDGGGILVSGVTGIPVIIEQSAILTNTAYDTGGGIAIYNNGNVMIGHSLIMGNYAYYGDGGGIYNANSLTLQDSTLSGNRAGGNGGGLINGNSAQATADLNNVTIADNQADADNDGVGKGGGVAVISGTFSLRNTLIGANMDLSGQAPDCGGSLDSQRYNLIQDMTGCTLTGNLIGNITGQNPLIGPLQNNGGSTWTHALLQGSPAIDKGNPTAPGSGAAACLTTDQRGAPRPVGVACDIGAFEYGGLLVKVYLPIVIR